MPQTITMASSIMQATPTLKELTKACRKIALSLLPKMPSEPLEALKISQPIFGVTGQEYMSNMDLAPILQAGVDCNFTPHMEAVLSAEKIENHPVKLNVSLCFDKHTFGSAAHWMNENLPGVFRSSPIERAREFVTTYLVARLVDRLRRDMYGMNAFRAKFRPNEFVNGQATSFDAAFDGIFQNIYSLANSGNATIVPTTANLSDNDEVYEFFNSVVDMLTPALKALKLEGRVQINMSESLWKKYCRGHRNANPFQSSDSTSTNPTNRTRYLGDCDDKIEVCVLCALDGTDFWWIGSNQNIKQVHNDSEEIFAMNFDQATGCRPIEICSAARFNYQLECRIPDFWMVSDNFENINPDNLPRGAAAGTLPPNASPLSLS